jgi:hypothetical protein
MITSYSLTHTGEMSINLWFCKGFLIRCTNFVMRELLIMQLFWTFHASDQYNILEFLHGCSDCTWLKYISEMLTNHYSVTIDFSNIVLPIYKLIIKIEQKFNPSVLYYKMDHKRIREFNDSTFHFVSTYVSIVASKQIVIPETSWISRFLREFPGLPLLFRTSLSNVWITGKRNLSFETRSQPYFTLNINIAIIYLFSNISWIFIYLNLKITSNYTYSTYSGSKWSVSNNCSRCYWGNQNSKGITCYIHRN